MFFHTWIYSNQTEFLKELYHKIVDGKIHIFFPQYVLNKEKGGSFFFNYIKQRQSQETIWLSFMHTEEEGKWERNRLAALEMRTWKGENNKTCKNPSLKKGSARTGSWKWVSMPFSEGCFAGLHGNPIPHYTSWQHFATAEHTEGAHKCHYWLQDLPFFLPYIHKKKD